MSRFMYLMEKYLGEEKVKKAMKPKKQKKDDMIKVGDKVRVDRSMIGGGNVGKVVEFGDDIVTVEFSKKVHGSKTAFYFIDDVKKV